MQASPGVKLELSGEDLNQLQSREVIILLFVFYTESFFMQNLQTLEFWVLCRSACCSMANASRSLWPIWTLQSSRSPFTPRLKQAMYLASSLKIVLIKVDAYVFFHLPGQFLNEDSLSKVKQSVAANQLRALISSTKKAKIFHHCYIFLPGRSNCWQEVMDWVDLWNTQTGDGVP